jgi:hypothetical protein
VYRAEVYRFGDIALQFLTKSQNTVVHGAGRRIILVSSEVFFLFQPSLLAAWGETTLVDFSDWVVPAFTPVTPARNTAAMLTKAVGHALNMVYLRLKIGRSSKGSFQISKLAFST